uniref:Bromo domain-containing protein n=1 Tax=Schistocephalus solidus TaxID=70667 RepID=A0A0V0J2P4_SCHSO
MEGSTESDGPRYKLCTFLFGNVDRQGRLEEDYAREGELTAISNLDHCHVAEVETTMRSIIAEEGRSPTSFSHSVSPVPPEEIKDYYDETEVINEGQVDLSTVENALPIRKDDEDEYDEQPKQVEVVPVGSLDSCVKSQMPQESNQMTDVVKSSPVLSSKQLQPTESSPIDSTPKPPAVIASEPEPFGTQPVLLHTPHSPTPLPADSPHSDPQLSVTMSSAGTSTASVTEAPVMSSSSIADDIKTSPYDEALSAPQVSPIIFQALMKTEDETADIASTMMPPPLHPAPLAASKVMQVRGPSPGVTSSPNARYGWPSPQPRIEYSNSGSDGSPSLPHICSPVDMGVTVTLNTPLGNLLPPEYANVDITTIFPHYSATGTPRWSRLFKLAHPLRTYSSLKRPEKNIISSPSNTPLNDRIHLIFRDLLDLGELPCLESEFEDANLLDEVKELERPPAAGADYLAGADNSWWRRAFAERLRELECGHHSSGSNSQIEKGKLASPAKVSNEGNSGTTGGGGGPVATHQSEAEDHSSYSKYSTWRFGPAKYWYDQLDIPEDADIAKWTVWSRNPSNVASACSKYRCESSSPAGSALTEPGVKKPGVEPAPQEPKQCRLQFSPSESNFLPYQLMEWEEDIIYDAQLSSTKISLSARQNAAFAGWIPSQHCRTMAAFQDAYQGKYPGILGYKLLTGVGADQTTAGTYRIPRSVENATAVQSITGASSSTPYAFFPVENANILNDSWRWDIIYDPLVAARTQPAFLLTLDLKDEISVIDHVINDDEVAAISGRSRVVLFGSTDDAPSGETGESEPQQQHPGQQQQQKSAINRASFHVSFGPASTRGMLTGALAKAAQGAEKVKRILGKHGFLAEGDWHSEDGEEVAANETAATMASAAAAASGLPPKDPLNLSNDEFYAMRSGGMFGCLARCGPLQHSTPAVELWPPFFPTFNTPLRLRQFHRVPLKRYVRGTMSQYGVPVPVVNLTKNIQKKMKEREEEKAASGGGDIFFMRTPSDLTGCDGEIVLFEYSEEYPPLMMQVGMATRLVNYYRPLHPRDPSLSPDPAANNSPPDFTYGSLVYVGSTDSPFLGVVRPGGCLQSLENNMFRAPVYPHKVPSTVFLVVRNRNGLWIRRAPAAFTVGQEVPLIEVPGPNSKRANNFARDFLQVYILRLFLRSTDEPKRIKMEEIRSAFPNHSESSVRKRLKICADFKRTGSDASWWVLRQDYRLPSEEEIRYLVQPEDVCAFFSMQAAELRLKDAGYGEKSLFVLDENQEEEEEKEGQPKMEDEVRAAPWNTTRAYLAAQRGGCFLELHGPADPTGCGEAFSYSKTSAKPGALFRQSGGEVARGLLKDKRTVTGTDADLRKLHLRDARALLRSFGISEADLKTFKRWEIIDMVRFTSTERAKQGEEEITAKFARGNRLSMAEQIRCYREECQRIFDLQNRVLSNTELLSSDEGEEEPSSDEEDEEETTHTFGSGKGAGAAAAGSGATSSSNAIGGVRLSSLPSSNRNRYDSASRNIESMLANRITAEELKHRQEEAEWEDLKRSVELGRTLKRNRKPTDPVKTDEPTPVAATSTTSAAATSTVYEANSTSAGEILDLPPLFPSAQKKVLRIVRTYSTGGQQYTRTELVPWSPVVEIYLKIRQTRDTEFIHNFIGSDDQFREQQRREKRRLQDQLRRVRKQQDLIRSRAGASGPLRDASGRLLGANRVGISSRRRHKPSSLVLKMRCGACGQTGHMRTNKECPMYGRSEGLPSGGVSAERRPGGSVASVGARGTASRSHLGDNIERETVAAAQELISKSVAELLAESAWASSGGAGEGEEGGVGTDAADHHHHHGGGSRADGHLSDDSTKGGDDQDRADSFLPELEENATTVEGTKLKLHPNLIRYLEAKKRQDLKMTINRPLLEKLDEASKVVAEADAAAAAQRRLLAQRNFQRGGGGQRRKGSMASAADDDYPTSTMKHRGNRRRIDPRVAINHVFEGIYKGLSQVPGYKIFMQPVKEKDFPNYYSEIENPMDLSQIRMKINTNEYSTREEFLRDIRLIHDNSRKFNGPHSAYTETAKKMCSYVMEEFCHKEAKLMRLESLVNPLLDEDDLVSLNFLLQKAVEAMRGVENSRAFHFPVDKRRYPDYYKTIPHPMDLSTLERLVKEHRYHSREEFFADADLLLQNCIKYNGQESVLTKIATKMLSTARAQLEADADTLETIEENIRQRLDDVSVADSQSQHGASLPNLETASTSKASSSRRRTPPVAPAVCQETKSGPRPEQTPYVSPTATAESLHPADLSRSARQCSTGVWYGADLYSDDEDSLNKQQTGEFRGKRRGSPNDTEEDEIEIGEEATSHRFSGSESKRRRTSKEDMYLNAAGDLTPEAASATNDFLDEDILSQDESQLSGNHEAARSPLSSRVGSRISINDMDYSSQAFMDERPRLSATEVPVDTITFDGKELSDTLVAQDLQLTDSDCSASLSEQGGELCADADFDAQNDARGNRSAFTPALDNEQANDGFGSPDYNYSRAQSRVEFFIGSDEDDSRSQQT